MPASFQKLDISAASEDQKKLALALAVDARKAEIDRFWSRTLVFWGFVAASFVTYGTLYDKVEGDDPLLLVLSCFGFLASLAWALQSRGSKYWQEAWEAKVGILEIDVIKISLFANQEPRQAKGWWGARRFSVSRLAIALCDLAGLVWIGLAWKSYRSLVPNPFKAIDLNPYTTAPNLIVFSTLAFMVSMLVLCRSKS